MSIRSLMVLLIVAITLLGACSGSHLTVKDDNRLELCPCPGLPNCVSSNSFMFYNSVAPFELSVPPGEAWGVVRDVVGGIPRTEIVEERPGYIHAKCKSLLFRFVDNLELVLDSDKGIISVRSSSVIGLFDFGVNYFRIEGVRRSLSEKGIIK